jgi:hypothetical protein
MQDAPRASGASLFLVLRKDLERSDASFGDGVILNSGSATDANGADDFAFLFEWDASGEDHHFAVIGCVDAEELIAGLGVLGEILGGNVEGAGGPGFLLGDVDGAKPSVGHALEGDKVSTFVDYGYVHWLTKFFGLFFGCGNDAAGVC